MLPVLHELESTDLRERRFVAACLTCPDAAGLRLEPLNGGEPFTVPLTDQDHVLNSASGTQRVEVADVVGG